MCGSEGHRTASLATNRVLRVLTVNDGSATGRRLRQIEQLIQANVPQRSKAAFMRA